MTIITYPSRDEDFGKEMLFDKYMKGPDRKVKGSSLCNTIRNVRRIFVLLGVKDLIIPSTSSISFLIIIIIITGKVTKTLDNISKGGGGLCAK